MTTLVNGIRSRTGALYVTVGRRRISEPNRRQSALSIAQPNRLPLPLRCKGFVMNAPIKLSDVPRRFLDPYAWAKLRAFAPTDLFALIYINAPCPDEANPNDFFWDRPRSAADAMRCYETGRSLLRQSRSLLSSGKLVATGRDSSGKCKTISASEWVDLWPMFATNTATGPDKVFTDVQVFEATSSETPHAQLSSECLAK